MSSTYDALTDRLLEATEPVVVYSFGELDRLIGGLPSSARRNAGWWANSRTTHDHARSWLDAERRARPDFNAGLVRFEVGEGTVGEPEPTESGSDTQRKGTGGSGGRAGSRGPTGSAVATTIGFEWIANASVTLDGDGAPVVPDLPSKPGIYRFDLTDVGGALAGVYVGEADDVARRVGSYRRPGKNQRTVRRINGRISEVLRGGGSVEVALVLEATLDDESLDLALAPARLLVGSAALILLLRQGYPVENL